MNERQGKFCNLASQAKRFNLSQVLTKTTGQGPKTWVQGSKVPKVALPDQPYYI